VGQEVGRLSELWQLFLSWFPLLCQMFCREMDSDNINAPCFSLAGVV